MPVRPRPMLLLALLSVPAFGQVSKGLPDFEFTSGMGVQVHRPHWVADPAGTMRRIRAAGFSWIRDDVTWTTAEPRKNVWNWRDIDPLMDAAQAAGLRMVGTLAFGNPAYTPGSDKIGPATPETRAAFVRFAVKAVNRYKGRGMLWEIWNEPDIKFWLPDSNVDDYVTLAKEVAVAIRKAAPGETIVAPGLSAENEPWLERAFRRGLLDVVDAVTVHPYRQDAPEGAGDTLYRHRALVHRYAKGRKIPVLVSEWGYSEAYARNGKRIGREGQTTAVSRLHAVALSEGSPLSILYNWQEDGPEKGEIFSTFGVTRRDGLWKGGLDAISTVAAQLDGWTYAGRLTQSNPRARVIVFRREDEVRLLGSRRDDAAAFAELPGSVGAYRRLNVRESVAQLGVDGVRGYDPDAPRTLALDEDPTVFESSETVDANTVALGRFPILPSVLGVWTEADAKREIGRIAGEIPRDALAYAIGERATDSGKVTWLAQAMGLPSARALEGIATRVSKVGHRLLVVRLKLPGARPMSVETLLR